MHQLLPLSVFWLLPLALMLEDKPQLDCIPRRSVPYHGETLSCKASFEKYGLCLTASLGNTVVDELFSYSYTLGDNAHLFREEGVFNYTTMLLREDLNLLVLGAREAVYALDLEDISRKVASVRAPL